jgi:hypothetical protein
MRTEVSMKRAARALVLSVLVGQVLGCGSVTALGDGGQAGAGSGTAGGGGGQSGTAGAAGSGGATGGGGNGGGAGGSGAVGTGHAGAGGGTAGAGGGRAGAGGGTGGAAGSAACPQVPMLDRSCAVDGDCLAVTHTTNCCGSAIWLGIRSSEKTKYGTLESACDASYPGCGCAAGPPTTDDGSVVPFGGMAGVSCQAGMCKTFSKACGRACDTGRSCSTCMAPDAGATSACSLHCMKDTDCTEPKRTKCQVSFAGGVCVDPTMACGPF